MHFIDAMLELDMTSNVVLALTLMNVTVCATGQIKHTRRVVRVRVNQRVNQQANLLDNNCPQ